MEIGLVVSAIALGFASGFHCIGMCGPIALSMGLTKKQAANFYLQNLTYQFGRIFTYSLLGALLGIIGQGFEMAGFQKYLTITAGVFAIYLLGLLFMRAPERTVVTEMIGAMRRKKRG